MYRFVKQHYFLLKLFILVVAYFAMGKLGMFLAVPPGYATAIYPSSGIALAGILLLGYRASFGVLLGSFLMNLSIAQNSAPITTSLPILIAFIIAIGASLQAVTGAYLVKRFADFPNPLASEKSVFTFMFYGGFLSTLVNSTISVSTLVVMNQIPLANFFTNWTTWWMGDAIGIFIFAPLTLVWFYQERDYFQHRKLLITSSVLIAFLITVMLVAFETEKETLHLKSEFDKDALALNVALDKSITTHLSVLHSLESFYAASNYVERDEFHTFVAQALNNFKGIQALEWCPIVMNTEREAFEKSVQNEGFLNFEIKERDENQQLIRANYREFYVPVTFVEPLNGNELAFGYEADISERREALENARDTGEIATSSKMTLVQDNQAGILVIAPIYKNHFPHQSLQERRQNILGYVQAVFHVNDIFNVALTHTHFEKLHLQLFDENAPTQAQHILFSNQLASFVLNEKGLFGKNISMVSSTLLPMGNRQWRFEIAPTQDYFAYHHSDNAWLILLTGLVLTSVIGVFVMVSSGREMVLEQLVKEKTNDLIEIDAELKRSNAELEQFAYAISHDMRQPLRMVTSYLSLIEKALQSKLDEDTRQFLTFAVDGAKRMDAMILSLLDYSRIGRQTYELKNVSTRAALDEALLFLKPTLETSRGTVEISGDWICLTANFDELTRLFQNLISNALKYHKENESPIVLVTAIVSNAVFRVEVKDSGIGIEPNQIERLFKVFSRLHVRTEFEGTGIGLALCRKIVEHHGGRYGVESQGKGQGSIFWFELPIIGEESR